MALFRSLSGSIIIDCVAAIFLVYIAVSYRAYSRLKHIPGPPGWGWSVLPLFLLHLRGKIHEEFGDLNKKYGPLVRIAPSTVLVCDPDVMRRMSAARSTYTRAPWYVAMQATPGVDNVFSTRDEQIHYERRRKMAPAYSGKENVSLEADIDGCVGDLINLIERKYISTPPGTFTQMDLAQKMQFFTTDVTSKIAFNDNFFDLRDDRDNHGYIDQVAALFPSMFSTTTIPSLLIFMINTGLAKLMAPSEKDSFGLGKILHLSQAQVNKRFNAEGKPDTTKGDMLASFLRHGLTRQEAEQEGVIQLLAGTDTTATALRTVLLCIISNPRVHARLVAEVATAVPAFSATHRIIPDDLARTLPYLQACIKEGMRWFPPIAGMLAKLTPPGGDTLCSYFVPANVSVAYSGMGIHHSPLLYGPDEGVFRPERWIHTSEGGDEPSMEKIQTMERNNELIFGHGKYQCLGKTVAAIESSKVVFEMIRRFDMTVVNTLEPWTSQCFGVHLQRNLWVVVRKREGSS